MVVVTVVLLQFWAIRYLTLVKDKLILDYGEAHVDLLKENCENARPESYLYICNQYEFTIMIKNNNNETSIKYVS